MAGKTIDVTASGSFTPAAHEGSMNMHMSVADDQRLQPSGGMQMQARTREWHDLHAGCRLRLASQHPGGQDVDLCEPWPARAALAKLPGFESLIERYLDTQRSGSVPRFPASNGGRFREEPGTADHKRGPDDPLPSGNRLSRNCPTQSRPPTARRPSNLLPLLEKPRRRSRPRRSTYGSISQT